METQTAVAFDTDSNRRDGGEPSECAPLRTALRSDNAETDREAVFEAGYSEPPDGTGFGLTLVKRIVDAHGGKFDSLSVSREAGLEITGFEFADYHVGDK